MLLEFDLGDNSSKTIFTRSVHLRSVSWWCPLILVSVKEPESVKQSQLAQSTFGEVPSSSFPSSVVPADLGFSVITPSSSLSGIIE